jgi:hypothetical protein
MLKTLLLASLFALPAAAQPAPPTPPGPPTGPAPEACRAKGDVLLEIDRKSEGAWPTYSIQLFDNGAVIRRDFNKDGKLTSTRGPSCLSSTTLAGIKKELAAAKFTIAYNDMTCEAISATWDEYQVRGKTVFAERMCGHESLDEASAKALHDAARIMEKATAPDPITSSRGKPVK